VWVWFAATFAGLLGVSLGRTVRTVRLRRQARHRLAPGVDEWRQHTIDITIDGAGDVPVATVIDGSHGVTRAFQVVTSDGATLQVPAGLVLQLATRLDVVDGAYHAAAGTPFSLFVSTWSKPDDPMRTPGRIGDGARLVLHPRGWNPAYVIDRALDVRWRALRLASAIAVPAGVVALIALDPMWVGLGIAGVAVLAFDAFFVQSRLMALYTTRSSPPALPE
jgi:hypothetical protein